MLVVFNLTLFVDELAFWFLRSVIFQFLRSERYATITCFKHFVKHNALVVRWSYIVDRVWLLTLLVSDPHIFLKHGALALITLERAEHRYLIAYRVHRWGRGVKLLKHSPRFDALMHNPLFLVLQRGFTVFKRLVFRGQYVVLLPSGIEIQTF